MGIKKDEEEKTEKGKRISEEERERKKWEMKNRKSA